MEDNKFSFKELGTISIDLPYAWFEVNIIKNNIELQPKSETLLLANSAGFFQATQMDHFVKTKKLKGPSFNIDLRTDNETPSKFLIYQVNKQ